MTEAWITGVGLLTGLGADRETTWRRLLAGESAVREITLFDTAGYRTHLAAQVDDGALPPAPVRHASRASRFALAAAAEALADAGLSRSAGAPWAIVFGGGAAGLFEAEGFLERRLARGPLARGAAELVEVSQDAPGDRVGEWLAPTGPRITVSTACSSSTVAVGLAAEMVRDGEVEIALAGGADALCRLTFAGFNSLRAVDGARCRPFDRGRAGLNIGEGAAVLVVESAEHARRRNARPLARVLGYGVTNDAFHMTQPEPSGAAWERTVRAALADAGVDPGGIGYINAHGTATEQNDPAERAAYARVFGERLGELPLSTVKGALGHCLCGAGGIEAAVTTLALARGVLPPTAGFAEPDDGPALDVIAGAGRPCAVEVALSCSFAFGGNSAALVLGRPA
jgi:3-oxoacyl-[acyl-carrier-protein] synthase II